MVDPLITAMGARAQKALEQNGVTVDDVEIDDVEDEYIMKVPSGDIDISGGVVRIKQV